MTLDTALSDLQELLSGADPAANGSTTPEATWRWQVRQRLSAVRDALREDSFRSWDGWLAARSGTSERERTQLIGRVSAIAAGVLDRLDTDRIATDVRRLLLDIEHYRQKMHDLLYDSVALELGGSE